MFTSNSKIIAFSLLRIATTVIIIQTESENIEDL